MLFAKYSNRSELVLLMGETLGLSRPTLMRARNSESLGLSMPTMTRVTGVYLLLLLRWHLQEGLVSI